MTDVKEKVDIVNNSMKANKNVFEMTFSLFNNVVLEIMQTLQ